MNNFCSLLKYAIFSNNFSLFSKTVPKKKSSEKSSQRIFCPTKMLLQQVTSDRQTSHHDAHHAHQLDEDVQRRT